MEADSKNGLTDYQSFFKQAELALRLPSPKCLTDWENFFNACTPLQAKAASTPKRSLFSPEKCNSFLQDLKTKYQAWHKSGQAINVWQVSGLGDDEVRNCRVLTWLFDQRGSHGQGALFLETLLKTSLPQKTGEIITNLLGQNYSTQREVCEEADNKNRVDIVCQSKDMLLYIEVKINAQAGDKQLERYINMAKRVAGPKRKWALLFLTRKPENFNDLCLESKDFEGSPITAEDRNWLVSITWNQVKNALKQAEEGLRKETLKENAPSVHIVPDIVQHFIKHITIFN